MDDAILKFAESMQFKLSTNEHKACSVMNPNNVGRSWRECTKTWLLQRLREEVLELEEALKKGRRNDIKYEAVDVGNFAMMIHDIALNRHNL